MHNPRLHSNQITNVQPGLVYSLYNRPRTADDGSDLASASSILDVVPEDECILQTDSPLDNASPMYSSHTE